VTLTPIVDAKKIVSDYLREHADLVSFPSRVLGNPPSKTDTPWVRVTQMDATDQGSVQIDRLMMFWLQCDCYASKPPGQEGGGMPEARRLGNTVRATLKSMERQTLDGAVISFVGVRGPKEIPDTSFEEARARTIVEADVYLRAV
jgi:hypothetical protein